MGRNKSKPASALHGEGYSGVLSNNISFDKSNQSMGSLVFEERAVDLNGDKFVDKPHGYAVVHPSLEISWKQLCPRETQRQLLIMKMVTALRKNFDKLLVAHHIYHTQLIDLHILPICEVSFIFQNTTLILESLESILSKCSTSSVTYALEDRKSKHILNKDKSKVPHNISETPSYYLDNPGQILYSQLKIFLSLCLDYKEGYLAAYKMLNNCKTNFPQFKDYVKFQPANAGVPLLASSLVIPLELPNTLYSFVKDIVSVTYDKHNDFKFISKVATALHAYIVHGNVDVQPIDE